MSIKDLVKNRFVEFAFYRSGFFYYNLIVILTVQAIAEEEANGRAIQQVYQFPVPIEDIGNATLPVRDKALTFMRWIRKAKEDNTLIKL